MIGNIAHSDFLGKPENRYKPFTLQSPRRYKRGMKLRLKELRKQRDWTQRVVADLAGMSLSYYTEIELGRKQINARRMEALAQVFGVEPHELIVSEGNQEFTDLVDLASRMTESQRKLLLGVARSFLKSDEQEQ